MWNKRAAEPQAQPYLVRLGIEPFGFLGKDAQYERQVARVAGIVQLRRLGERRHLI